MYKVILIDDELVAVNALKNRVEWKKYDIDEVYVARSMKQAQELFRHEAIDIMLCDIEMPNGSGLELFEWVKAFYPSVECIYVSCHPDYQYIRQAMKLGSFDYILKPVDYKELNILMKQIIVRISQKDRKSKHLENKENSEHVETQDVLTGTDETVLAIRAYIRDHIDQDININEIAEFVHLNPNYIMRLFKSKTEKSIIEYITDLRIDKAKELLLRSSDSIQHVAQQVGYSNYSYFTRLFKKRMKMTPNDYRKNSKG
jgi:YesN/AraC family two-component response regulator